MDQKYNNLVIFDLDGVLIDSRELHFQALNYALGVYDQPVISREEHLSTYDGLPTTEKLKLLTKNKGIPERLYNDIWRKKQEQTLWLLQKLKLDDKVISIFSYLKSRGFKIAVASNAIQSSVEIALKAIGVLHYVDCVVSNEGVEKRKPYPSMYWKCMEKCNAIPRTTIIIEDSHIGRQGAIDSGATLLPVENEHDLTMEKILDATHKLVNGKIKQNIPWRDATLNVVIPMAGHGSRFADAGYTFPKPLIDVNGKPMIQAIVENLNIEANYIFIVQKSHYEKYNLEFVLKLIAPGCKIVQVDGVTEGAAVTVLLASQYIANDQPLLIANSDQIIEWNSNEVMYAFMADQIDAGILTFQSTHPKWSYARLDDQGFVAEVAEKKPISTNATVGIYFWKKGKDFCNYAIQMIDKNIRTNNEFYVAPVFNEAIADGKKVRVKEIKKMWGIGTPEDLTTYLNEKK